MCLRQAAFTFADEEVVGGGRQQALIKPGLQGGQQRLQALLQNLKHHSCLLTSCTYKGAEQRHCGVHATQSANKDALQGARNTAQLICKEVG